jgi:hypothetical protein
MPFDVTCPECGIELHADRDDIYAHALSCLRVESNRGPEWLRDTYGKRDDEHAKRVMTLVNAHLGWGL